MMMRPLALLLLVAGMAAPRQAVFRSGADLVRFDVRVTDGSGRPLQDLRSDELEIVEDGTPRPIVLFQHLDEPSGSYAEAALRAVSAEVSSNRGAPRGHLYLFVFDQAHITPGNEPVARRAAEEFIKKRVRASDRIALVGIPGPGPQVNLTSDRTRAIVGAAEGPRRARAHGELAGRQVLDPRGLRSRRRQRRGDRRHPHQAVGGRSARAA